MAAGLIADRRLYLAKDRATLVEAGGPGAAFLLAPEGGLIEQGDAVRLGLVVRDGVVVQPGPEPEAKEQPKPEDKEAAKPEDKGKR